MSCEILKKRLAVEEGLQGLVAQYVQHVVYLDESEQLNPFLEQFNLNVDDLAAPMLYIVSSEGKHLVTKLGAPAGDELPALLREGVEKAAAAKKAD